MDEFGLHQISTFINHDRAFIYEPRGFQSVYEMNDAIVERWNRVVDIDDDVYVLGDIMLNNNEGGIKLLQSLKGRIHIILGNHDSSAREALYRECYNVVEVVVAARIRYNGYHFYLSHYPTFTGNLEKESLKQMAIDLFGHTHDKRHFYQDIPFMYNVACDAHNCTPVLLDDIIIECNEKVKECISKL